MVKGEGKVQDSRYRFYFFYRGGIAQGENNPLHQPRAEGYKDSPAHKGLGSQILRDKIMKAREWLPFAWQQGQINHYLGISFFTHPALPLDSALTP
ncbi:MAG: hypothetical protein QXS76_01905 [Candidatus Bathyarchaeia archaeon]